MAAAHTEAELRASHVRRVRKRDKLVRSMSVCVSDVSRAPGKVWFELDMNGDGDKDTSENVNEDTTDNAAMVGYRSGNATTLVIAMRRSEFNAPA
jgi:hypothetical protein